MNNLYTDLNTYMIRTPLKSKNFYYDFFTDLNNKDDLKYKIIKLGKLQWFRESILISSKTLYDSLLKYINGHKLKKEDKFLNSLLKYIIRMSTRPTPFGIMAGINISNLTYENDKFEINNFNKICRVDIEWLFNLIKNLENIYYDKLSFKINSCVFINGNRAILPYSTDKENIHTKIDEISIRCTNAFKNIYEFCSQDRSFNEIISNLKIQYKNIDTNILTSFVKELIQKEFLISSLRPPLTANDQFDYLLTEIKSKLGDIDLLHHLIEIKFLIDQYKDTEPGDGEELYLSIYNKMIALYKCNNPLEVDMKINFDYCQLNKNIILEINELLNILFLINNTNSEYSKIMEQYKILFIETYGTDREVNILELLNEDKGIGAPTSYSGNLNRRIIQPNNLNENNNIHQYFYSKYVDALLNNKDTIEIDDLELEKLNLNSNRFDHIPDSLEINLFLKMHDGKKVYYLGPNLGSIAAGKSFGRFSYMCDKSDEFFETLNKSYKNILNDDNYILCELSYLSKNIRNSNVTRNITKSDYEISLFTNSSKNYKNSLDLKNIFIGIENNKFYAREKISNKKIIFSINNMLNPNLAPDVIRFLYEIMFQDQIMWYDFPWDKIFIDSIYLPQIKYKNFILTPEKWKIRLDLLGLNKKSTFIEFKNAFKQYKEKYRVKRYFYITFSDNRILIDSNNDILLRILFNEIKNTEVVINSSENYEEIVTYNNEHYVSEFIIPLIRQYKFDKKINANNEINKLDSNINNMSREISPFDNWLYFKLYGVTSRENEIITEYFEKFLNKLINNNLIKKYFFIKYVDPEYHIRLRINADKKNLLELYPQISVWLNELKSNGLIRKYVIDSYNREIERYGGENLIDYAEDIFSVDSLIAQKIIKLISENNSEIIGVLLIISYLEQVNWNYKRQLNFLDKQINKAEYRNEFKSIRKELIDICNSNNWINFKKNSEIFNILNIFMLRENTLQLYKKQLYKSNLSYREEDILDSLIHMSFNRIFGINREFERKCRALARHTLYSLKYYKENSNDK